MVSIVDPEERKRLRMTGLAITFPSMHAKLQAGTPGIEPWDVIALTEATDGWTAAEKQVVAFLASVWDPWQDYVPRFDFFEAWCRWDAAHRAAFRAWMEAPFTC